LECGEIYLTAKNDPLSAIYHYREYLRHSPTNRQTALVRQRIETAEKAYLSHIPVLRQAARDGPGDLLRTIKSLQDENAKLSQQASTLNIKLRELHAEISEQPKKEVILVDDGPNLPHRDNQQRPRQYSVAKGDTLSSISLKVYGTSGRWREIFEANSDRIRSPSQLKVGLALSIPP
jgi:nucleoid-associated protein YgaU